MKYLKLAIASVLIAVFGVYVVDYPFHLFLSTPMENITYFIAKDTLYTVYSFVFLYLASRTDGIHIDLTTYRLWKIFLGGFVVAGLWGIWYNVLPWLLEVTLKIDFYPFGIPVSGLSVLGQGLIFTGVAFGIVHTVAWMVGYYFTRLFPYLRNN